MTTWTGEDARAAWESGRHCDDCEYLHRRPGPGGLADMETVCSLPTCEPEGCIASNYAEDDEDDENDIASEAAVKSGRRFFDQLWRAME